jgi:hypothetical protein
VEQIGPELRKKIIDSGGLNLIRLINAIPIEALARLKKLVQE